MLFKYIESVFAGHVYEQKERLRRVVLITHESPLKWIIKRIKKQRLHFYDQVEMVLNIFDPARIKRNTVYFYARSSFSIWLCFLQFPMFSL